MPALCLEARVGEEKRRLVWRKSLDQIGQEFQPQMPRPRKRIKARGAYRLHLDFFRQLRANQLKRFIGADQCLRRFF